MLSQRFNLGMQLVIGATGCGIGVIAVLLRCLDAQHQASVGVVANQALCGAWIRPRLGARCIVGLRDGDGIVQGVRDDFGVAIVSFPFIGCTA